MPLIPVIMHCWPSSGKNIQSIVINCLSKTSTS